MTTKIKKRIERLEGQLEDMRWRESEVRDKIRLAKRDYLKLHGWEELSLSHHWRGDTAYRLKNSRGGYVGLEAAWKRQQAREKRAARLAAKKEKTT